jgi:Aldo/keto reductase family
MPACWTFQSRRDLLRQPAQRLPKNASRRFDLREMKQQRNVGKSGLRVSSIGLGCNNFGRSLDLAASRPVIHKALDLGITFFDCADVYGGRRRDDPGRGAGTAPQGHRARHQIRPAHG